MVENVALAFLSASLLSGIGIKRGRRRISWLEIVAAGLATIVLILSALAVVPALVFYALFAISLALNITVCIRQYLETASARGGTSATG